MQRIEAARHAAYHVMGKPIGPICNLDCTYCFYLEKERLFPANERFRMSDEVLENYIHQYIASQSAPVVHFTWQGGEPTLLGVEFFKKVVSLQRQYADGREIANALQTNGVLLDDEWAGFLAENHFLVGVSVDGPARLHDRYRVDKKQRPTFEAVMRGVERLKAHGAEFNTLTVVNRVNSKEPLEVYRFLKEMGSGFIQFIPLVERRGTEGGGLAMPPAADIQGKEEVTEWSVRAEQYGAFLCAIFDEWVRHDVGRVFVQLFDVALGNWLGRGSSLCVFAERCGAALALEHNGDVYSCDHYVYPQYRLGNLLNAELGAMVNSREQRAFGDAKAETLPDYCRRCEVRFACNGECPKHRFLRTPDGEGGLNYLCAGYRRFFNHIDPHMKRMARLLEARRAPAEIMGMLSKKEGTRTPGRNDPCPCGSGRKFKVCCMTKMQR